MLAEAALALCLASNATADAGGRAEVRSGAFSGFLDGATGEPTDGLSLDLRLRPQAALGGHRPGLDGSLTYNTDLRLRLLGGVALIPFASHAFAGSLEGGRSARGARFRLNGGLSLGQLSFDPLDPESDEQPTGLAALGQDIVVPFTSASVGAGVSNQPARRWGLGANGSGRLFFVPILDENGNVDITQDPQVRFGPSAQASVSHALTRDDQVGLQLRGESIFGPVGLVYGGAELTGAWSRQLLPAWPFSIRAGAIVTQQTGFDPGVLPVGAVSLTARFPSAITASVSSGVSMGYDAFNDASNYSTSTSLSVARGFGRGLTLSASARAFWRLLVVTQRDAIVGDNFVGVGRLSAIMTLSDNLFFEGGFSLTTRSGFRAIEFEQDDPTLDPIIEVRPQDVLQGQLFIAVQGGAGWDS